MWAVQVVLATAGPFAKYGDKVVEQSVEQGTHYFDITGSFCCTGRTADTTDLQRMLSSRATPTDW